jgi:5-bromo-4-chloroindolyl phosphate hydrolysis protein
MFVVILIVLFVVATVVTLYFKNRAQVTHPMPAQMGGGVAGLDARDQAVFREAYDGAKENVDELAKYVVAHDEMRKLVEENGMLRVARGILSELKKEPAELPLVNDFVYTHLPNAVRLMKGYHEIALHKVFSAEDEQRLAESRDTLQELAVTFNEAYEKLVKSDLSQVDDEVYFAKETLKD